jgi:phosphate transport system substrate-binding protein
MGRFLGALAGALLALAFGLTGASAEPIRGAGSTFAAPLVQSWAQLYRAMRADGGDFVSPDWTVDYEVVGSLGGMLRLANPELDFAATDAPLPPEELKKRGLAQFPFVIGGVAIVHNLPGIAAGQLRLNADVAARIYLGVVLNWSDPAIAVLNPGLTLPNLPIAVVRRRDGSGTTFTFTQYLASGNEEWAKRFGANTDIQWPVGQGAEGNRGVAERVRSTSGSIGYVEYGQVRRLNLAYATVQNKAGQFVRPEQAAFQRAAAAADWKGSPDFYLHLTDATAADAYPISATTFALVPRGRLSRNRLGHALDFFRLGLEQGGGQATSLGYVPMPREIVDQVKGYWANNLRPGS